jgi:type VI secretion system secreted protein VgrG
LIPGFYFTLNHYPRSALNQAYLITAVHHKAEQPQVLEERASEEGLKYTNDFACIPLAVPFRPQRKTSRPLIRGTQTAIVVGPDAEEIYTDDEGHGRVKVQFHWDREGQYNQDSSCWVRVSQLWAGAGWGGLSLPRIGQEVIVEFLEGDPDLPIIIGRVYNADQMPPYTLPANRTQSGIKSRSSKGGTPENFNEIRFEDQKGSEEMYLHAEKDQTTVVENDKTENVGHDEMISIGNDRTETVGNNETISIGANRTETVGANESITVAQNRTRNVGQNETVSVALLRTHNVGVNEMINVGAAQEVTVGGAQTVTVGATQVVEVRGNRTIDAKAKLSTEVGTDEGRWVHGTRETTVVQYDRLYVGDLVIDAGNSITIQTGKASITMTADGTIEINGEDIKIGGSKIEAQASTIELEGGQEFKVQAAIIKLN